MAKQKTKTSALQGMAHEMETKAYDAYREWPLLLVKRQKELKAQMQPASVKEKV